MPHDETGAWLPAGETASGSLPRESSARGRSRPPSASRPVSWRIADGYVLLESNEMAAVDDWTAAIGEAVADVRFEPGMPVLHDTRRRLGAPDPNEVREGVKVVASLARASTIRRWGVVARTGAHYGMARMAQILSELELPPRPEFRVFQDLAEAQDWVSGSGPGRDA